MQDTELIILQQLILILIIPCASPAGEREDCLYVRSEYESGNVACFGRID